MSTQIPYPTLRPGRALLLLTLLPLLGGCWIKVNTGSQGTVTTDLGDDCQYSCSYQVNEGESFQTTFTATPNTGAEFERWDDTLGDEFRICPNPTQPVCTIAIDDLDPSLAPLGFELTARFRVKDGTTINYVGYGSPQQLSGFFRQVSPTLWLKTGGYAQDVAFTPEARSASGMTLRNNENGDLYVIDLTSGQILRAVEGAQPVYFNAIVGISAEPTAALLNRVTYGNLLGVLKGTITDQGDGSWLDSDLKGKREPATLREVARGEDTVQLHDEQSDRDLEIDLGSGVISANDGEFVGYIHETRVPVDGWSVREVQFADPDTGEIVGSYRYTGVGVWSEYVPGNDESISMLTEVERRATLVNLEDKAASRKISINFGTGMIDIGPSRNVHPLPVWDIVDYK